MSILRRASPVARRIRSVRRDLPNTIEMLRIRLFTFGNRHAKLGTNMRAIDFSFAQMSSRQILVLPAFFIWAGIFRGRD